MKTKLALAITAITLAGCSSMNTNDDTSYYSEPTDGITNSSEMTFESLDDVFASEQDMGYSSEEKHKSDILNEGSYAALNLDELTDEGVDISALNTPIVHFEFDSYELSDDAKEVIQKHIKLLNEVQDLKVILEGHTDSIGDRAYNLKLGEKRALAVKQFAIQHGVAPEKIEVISYGEEKLLKKDKTNEDHSRNRRAEFVYQ